MSSRLVAVFSRDASSWFVLLAATFSIALIVASQPGSAGNEAKVTAGALPLLSLLASIDQVFPEVPARSGKISILVLLIHFWAALGLFYCAWRLTRNRVVSLGAGFLLAAHPLAWSGLLHSAGLRDLVGLALATWVFALNVAPRTRSSRFPAQPPSAFRKDVFGLLLLGLLSAPGFWIMPILILGMDIAFHREPGRSPLARNWKSYGPYLALVSPFFLVDLIWGASLETIGVAGELSVWPEGLVAIFLSGREGVFAAAVLVHLIVLMLVVVAVVEILFDLGRRRSTLPYLSFAAWVLLGALLGEVLGRNARVTGGSWLAFSGLALAFPVLTWRLVMVLCPLEEQPDNILAEHSLPSWADLLRRSPLTPLPSLESLPPLISYGDWAPPPQVEQSPALTVPPEARLKENSYSDDLNRALEKIGRGQENSQETDDHWDRDFCSREVETRLVGAKKVLAFLPSRSAYAGVLATTSESLTLVEKRRSRNGFPELDGLDHVRIFDYDGHYPWPEKDDSVDFFLSVGCLSQLRTPELQGCLKEIRRALKPLGLAVAVFRSVEVASDVDANPLPQETVMAFCAHAGLEVLETADSISGGFHILMRRAEG